MAKTDRVFSESELVAAARLAVGDSVERTAKAANVSVRTIYRWRDDEQFRRLVIRQRDAMLSLASGRLAKCLAKAVDVLRDLMRSEVESIRLKAATAVLEQSVKLREHGELARAVAELRDEAARRAAS